MNYDPGLIGNEGRLALPGEAGRPQRRWLVPAIIIAVVALLAAYWAYSRGSGEDAAAEAPSQVPTVTFTIPGQTSVNRVISATGSLAARVDMPVGVAGEGGMITRVLVQPGDWVGAGQVLATIDRQVQVQSGEALEAQIAVAQSDARLAQSELDRAQQLVDRGFVSKADVDRRAASRDAAIARVRVAQAQLQETRARTGRLDVRAPAAGLVLTRSVEPGQVVSSGSGTLFRLARGGELELQATLSEGDLALIGVGTAARVTPVGSSESFTGRVWQLSPVIDPQTRQGIARVALSYNKALRPGGFAAVTFQSGESRAPLLPQSAVLSDDKGNYVYILNNKNETVRQPITVGQVSDAGVAIAGGLTGTERVIVSAGAFLNPGQKVIPIRQKAGA